MSAAVYSLQVSAVGVTAVEPALSMLLVVVEGEAVRVSHAQLAAFYLPDANLYERAPSNVVIFVGHHLFCNR